MRLRLIPLVLLLSVTVSLAQETSDYDFRRVLTSEPWTDLQGTVIPVTWSEGLLYGIDVGTRPFRAFHQEFVPHDSVAVVVGTNGVFEIVTPTRFLIFDGVFTQLDSAVPGTTLSYRIDAGIEGDVLRIRYDSVRIASITAPHTLSFELRYHFATGVFETHYGPADSVVNKIFDAQRAPYMGLCLTTPTFTKMYGKIWPYRLPDDPWLDTARTVKFPQLFGVPQPGTVYRYSPRPTPTSVTDADGGIVGEDVDPNSVEYYDYLGRRLLYDKGQRGPVFVKPHHKER